MRSKYNARRTMVDGINFASQAEAARYQQLKILEAAGEISGLELQPRYPIRLTQGGALICTYVGDFRYRDSDGTLVLEDVKGHKTPVYILKRKLVEALYPITITEIT